MMRGTPEQRNYNSIGYTWSVVLEGAPFSDFSGLTTLYIDISRGIRNLVPTRYSPDPETKLLLPPVHKGFEGLMSLPLKEVKVICAPSKSLPEVKETTADRVNARLLEEMLMGK